MGTIAIKVKKVKLDQFKKVSLEEVYLEGILFLNDLTSKINKSRAFRKNKTIFISFFTTDYSEQSIALFLRSYFLLIEISSSLITVAICKVVTQ